MPKRTESLMTESLCHLILVVTTLLSGSVLAAPEATYLLLPGGNFVSHLALDGAQVSIRIVPFLMRMTLVTEADYQGFVQTHPAWQRDKISPLYATGPYLGTWQTPLTPGVNIDPRSPVTEISWFAARAYCASENARLPTWYEWEYAAAANRYHNDARNSSSRHATLLRDILNRTGQIASAIKQHPANFYGLYDMNTLVWEWVNDYAALFLNADARNPDQQNLLQLCGGSALAFNDRSDYPLMMRVAALSAMQPSDVSNNIGFRCVRDLPQENVP